MKTFYKKFSEKFIEGLLLISSTVTSFTVLLIVVFLFNEGISLFNETAIEDGHVIALNKKNTLNKISSVDLKNIFDQKITHWNEIGGTKDSILLFRLEDISLYYTDEQIGENFEHLPECISRITDSLPGVLAFFSTKKFFKF